MASNAALQRYASAAAAGAPLEPRQVPPLTGREIEGNGTARRVALNGGTLSWQVKRTEHQYAGPVQVDAQQLASYHPGDIVLVPADVADARASLITEGEYDELNQARTEWENRDTTPDITTDAPLDEALEDTAPKAAVKAKSKN